MPAPTREERIIPGAKYEAPDFLEEDEEEEDEEDFEDEEEEDEELEFLLPPVAEDSAEEDSKLFGWEQL